MNGRTSVSADHTVIDGGVALKCLSYEKPAQGKIITKLMSSPY